MAINNLQNNEQSKKMLTIAFGTVSVKGHLCWTKVAGTSPNHQITAFNALGEGEFNKCKGAFYKGIEIPPADYEFHPGALATGMTTGAQTVGTFFDKDVPHSRTATIGYKIPTGFGSADTQGSPPTDFEGIFEAKKCPDFNGAGVQTDFSFTANPAREIIELLKTYARIPNLPTVYASSAAYWLSRIDFGNWTEFRDYHEQTETVDYTTIPDFKGFGLTAKFYNGTNFQTFITKFVRPTIEYPTTSVAPVIGVTGFSAQFDGFLKAPATENRTFHFTHDNGVKFWIVPVGTAFGTPLVNSWTDDGTQTPGTHTGTYALTAGQFYKIRIQWNSTVGTSQLKFEWSSTSQTQQVVPSQYLYPEVEQQKIWESNVWIDTPLSVGDGIRRILNQTNSIMQDVKGKLRFFCLDALTPSFTLDESKIDSIKFRYKDLLQSEPFTELEAEFKDLDHQYLNEPAKTISHKLETFSRQTSEKVLTVPLYNTTRWQARKLLVAKAKFDYENRIIAEIASPMAKSYEVVAGDLITVQHRKLGDSPRTVLVRKSVDRGISEIRNQQGKEIEKRIFTVQDWSEGSEGGK